jgi:CheY-like chemotaxis protein
MNKILLVEDDPVIVKMYLRTFRLAGFEIDTAKDGKEGLEKLKSFKPEAILLDILMPTMNGIEMLDAIRKNPKTKDLPVIILTNVSNDQIDQAIFDRGVSLTLIKSSQDPDQVVAWVKSILGSPTRTKHAEPAKK